MKPLVAVGVGNRVDIFRILRSAASCVSISRILAQEAKTPSTETQCLELSLESELPFRQISLSPEANLLATLDEGNTCRIYCLTYEAKLTAKQIHQSKLANISTLSLGLGGHLILNYPKRFRTEFTSSK